MKKIKFTLVTLLLILTASLRSQEARITLDKSKKIESTFSGDINQESTIHLIINKDKKTKFYEVITLFYDENDQIIQLEPLSFKKKPEIISYHLNKEKTTLTVLFNMEISRERYALSIVDYDLITRENTTKHLTNFIKPNLIFKLPNKSIFINTKEGKGDVELLIIENSTSISNIQIAPTSKQKSKFETIFKSGIDAINTNEYVEYGSFSPCKAYFLNDLLKFAHVDKKTGELILLTINIHQPDKLFFTSLPSNNFAKIKDTNFYLFDNKIFQLFHTKSNVYLKVTDIKTKNILFDIDVTNELAKRYDPKEIKRYISKTAKSFYSPTITVNASIEENMVMNIGYVDNRIYHYYHDWWFQHWMWQQTFMQPPTVNLPSFGPNPEKYDLAYTPLINEQPFQLVINSNFEMVENASLETVRRNIDKDKYRKRLDSNANINYSSLAFTANSARSIYLVKDQNTFIISKSDYE